MFAPATENLPNFDSITKRPKKPSIATGSATVCNGPFSSAAGASSAPGQHGRRLERAAGLRGRHAGGGEDGCREQAGEGGAGAMLHGRGMHRFLSWRVDWRTKAKSIR